MGLNENSFIGNKKIHHSFDEAKSKRVRLLFFHVCSENRTTEIVNDREVTIVTSTLFIDKAIPRHAGNYSCVVPDKAKTTIAVHVLNGESQISCISYFVFTKTKYYPIRFFRRFLFHFY